MQGGYGFRGRFFDWIGDTNQARRFAVQSGEHHRLAVAAIAFSMGFQCFVKSTDPAHHLGVADGEKLSIDPALRAFSGDRFKISRLQARCAALFGPVDNGLRKRVLASAFNRGSVS